MQDTDLFIFGFGSLLCLRSTYTMYIYIYIYIYIRTECGNYRGSTNYNLLIAGKAFARILLDRLTGQLTPEILPETQCSFRANRSTTDMIFFLRQLQEKCIEQDKALYIVFMDFTKAFDTVGRSGLWQLLSLEVWMSRKAYQDD